MMANIMWIWAALVGVAKSLEVQRAATVAARTSPLSLVRSSAGELEAAVEKAKKAAEETLKIAKFTLEQSVKNNEVVTPAKAFQAEAKVAAKNAKDALDEATALEKETRKAAEKAALQAAKEFFKEVKQKGEKEAKKAAAAKAALEKKMEIKAAVAAGKAAEPYNQYILRGQKVIVEYQTRAQELATTSNSLKSQGMQLAGSADQYQLMGQTIQADQIMMQAHTLFQQGDMMKKEALRLKAAADSISSSLPTYQLASQAAAAAAAAAANPDMMPEFQLPYFLQMKSDIKTQGVKEHKQ